MKKLTYLEVERDVNDVQKLVYTVKEAAEVLSIGISKAYELVNQNIIPNKKIGKRIVIPIESLDKWINGKGSGVEK